MRGISRGKRLVIEQESSKVKAMILAAGLGERLRPLTDTTPKPLLEVNGKPLIQHHVEKLAAAGVKDIVINTSWLAEKIEAFLGDGSRFGVSIKWSREDEPLETGGGIRRALPLLVINGDVWTDFPIGSLTNRDWPEDMDAHLVLVPNPVHHTGGDFSLNSAGRLLYPQEGDETSTFSGISVMRPEIFALYSSASEKFAIRDVLVSGIKAGCVSGEICRSTWWDVGTYERLQALNTLLSGREVDTGKKPRIRIS